MTHNPKRCYVCLVRTCLFTSLKFDSSPVKKWWLENEKLPFWGWLLFRDELLNYVGCTRASRLWLEVVDPTWSNDIHPSKKSSPPILLGPSVQRPGTFNCSKTATRERSPKKVTQHNKTKRFTISWPQLGWLQHQSCHLWITGSKQFLLATHLKLYAHAPRRHKKTTRHLPCWSPKLGLQ